LVLGAAQAEEPTSTQEPSPDITEAAPDSTVHIPFEEYDLDNGMHVILSPDKSVPFVWVNIWYQVGAKDEMPGRSGFAHLFEHLMFQGSEHRDDEYFAPLQKVGAVINGTTNWDRTNYFEGVPAEQLPLALYMESDRMGWLLPALTEEKLENQKLVVRNERRQSYENRPYGMVWKWLAESLFEPTHPYHIPTIGRHEDIDAASLADVKAFFRQWYVPSNASLSIAGDYDPEQAKALIEKFFGHVPAGPKPSPVLEPTATIAAAARLSEEKVVRYTDDVPHQKVWIAWHSPGLYRTGDADLDVLASVLASGKDSRLYSHLVHDTQVAKSIKAYQVSLLLSSFYVIEATASPGKTTDEVVTEVDRVMAEMLKDGPTEEEVQIAKVNWEARFFGDMASIRAKSNQLNKYYIQTGITDYIGTDLARYLMVTPGSVHKAQEAWLTDKRVVLHVRPEVAEAPTEPVDDEKPKPVDDENTKKEDN
jgi:predicted Zn-dependent peptidase